MPFIKAKNLTNHTKIIPCPFCGESEESLWRDIPQERVCAGESSAVIAWQASTGVGISHRIH